MESFFRSLMMGIDGLIYPLIPTLYQLFFELSKGKFFSSDAIQTITGNLYILVSVAMLFAFGVELIKAIINPDLMADKTKGTTAFFKRLVISILLITAIPIIFKEIYVIQDKILDNSLIEKLILGQGQKTKDYKNTGQYLAGLALNSTLYPAEGATSDNENLSDDYSKVINKDISKIGLLSDYIKEKFENESGENEYVFVFHSLTSVAVGFFIVYMLVLCCFDMALRLTKLSFYEITAPISVMSYIIVGTSSLQKWFKEVFRTYAGVFLKIISLSFLVVGLTQIQNYFERNKITTNDWIAQLFVICGLLTFVKQLPQILQSSLGINIDSKGGIKGRLAGMAAVGGVASSAWQKASEKVKGAVGAVPKAGVGLATTAVAGIGAGAVAGTKFVGRKLDDATGNRVSSGARKLKDNKFGRGVSVLNAGVKAGGGGASIKAMKEAYNKQFAPEKYSSEQKRNNKINGQILDNIAKKSKGVVTTSTKDGVTTAKINRAQLMNSTNGGAVNSFNALAANALNGINEIQNTIVRQYNEKRHEKMKAERNNKLSTMVNQQLINALNANTDSVAKMQIQKVYDNFNAGTMSANSMRTALFSIKTSSGDHAVNISAVNEIVQEAKLMSDGNANAQIISASDIAKELEKRTLGFSSAETKYNAMLEQATDLQKNNIKQLVSVGNKMSKEELEK